MSYDDKDDYNKRTEAMAKALVEDGIVSDTPLQTPSALGEALFAYLSLEIGSPQDFRQLIEDRKKGGAFAIQCDRQLASVCFRAWKSGQFNPERAESIAFACGYFRGKLPS